MSCGNSDPARCGWIALLASRAGVRRRRARPPHGRPTSPTRRRRPTTLLPLPCGGAMAFVVSMCRSPDALDDRRLQLGSPEPRFAYAESTRERRVGGGFVDPEVKNQRYYLIGEVRGHALQYDAVMSASLPTGEGRGRLPQHRHDLARSGLFLGRTIRLARAQRGGEAAGRGRHARLRAPADRGRMGVCRAWRCRRAGNGFQQTAFPMPGSASAYVWFARHRFVEQRAATDRRAEAQSARPARHARQRRRIRARRVPP